MPRDRALELFRLWQDSHYLALPFSGSLMEQPWWVYQTFISLSARDAWHAREEQKKRDKSKPPGRP